MRILFVTGGAFAKPFGGYRSRALTSFEYVNRLAGGSSLLANESLFRVFARKERRRDLARYAAAGPAPVYGNWLLPERIPLFGAINARLVTRALRLVARLERPDILHVHSAFYPRIDAGLKRALGVRVLLDYHGSAPEEAVMNGLCRRGDGRHMSLKRLERVCVMNADRLVCVSETHRDELLAELGTAAPPVTVIPCCADTRLFSRDEKAREERRRRLKLDGKFVVAYAGNFPAWNPAGETAKVLARIARAFPDAHPMVVCARAHHPMLERELVAQGVQGGGFTLADAPHERMPEWLSAADMAVLVRAESPVNRVAFPVKLAEYLACGLPVVATAAVRDAARIVAGEGLGVVLRDTGEESLGEGMESLRALRERMALEDLPGRCAAYARAHLSWDVGAERYMEIYRRCIQHPPMQYDI
jgi:glycosyltransferase involved in cell wall biosynthesis